MYSLQEYSNHADELDQEVYQTSCQLAVGTIKTDFKSLIEKQSLYHGAKQIADQYRKITALGGPCVDPQAAAVTAETAAREDFARACKDYNEAHGGTIFHCLLQPAMKVGS